MRFDPCVGKIPWRRAWPPTPVFLPGESHGQRSLAGYSPWSRKELDMTEQLNSNSISLLWKSVVMNTIHTHTHTSSPNFMSMYLEKMLNVILAVRIQENTKRLIHHGQGWFIPEIEKYFNMAICCIMMCLHAQLPSNVQLCEHIKWKSGYLHRYWLHIR